MDRRTFLEGIAATATAAALAPAATSFEVPLFQGNFQAMIYPGVDDVVPSTLRAWGWEGEVDWLKPVTVRRARIELTTEDVRNIGNPQTIAAWERRIREALAQAEPYVRQPPGGLLRYRRVD